MVFILVSDSCFVCVCLYRASFHICHFCSDSYKKPFKKLTVGAILSRELFEWVSYLYVHLYHEIIENPMLHTLDFFSLFFDLQNFWTVFVAGCKQIFLYVPRRFYFCKTTQNFKDSLSNRLVSFIWSVCSIKYSRKFFTPDWRICLFSLRFQ